MGEPLVEISENPIYPIYPATHAKSLKHLLASKLNTDNNCFFKLIYIYVLLLCSVINITSGTGCSDGNCVCVYLKVERAVWELKEPALLSEQERKNRLPEKSRNSHH